MNSHSNTKYHAYIDEIRDNLKVTLQNGLEFINWDKYIDKDSRVFVKPNFTFPYYKEGVTTSPQLLKYLLEILKSKADTVILGESDGGNHSFTAEQAFEGHNMYEICQETGVELVNLSKLPSRFVEDKIQGKRVKVQLPKLLLEEIDCFISVPVLKVHAQTTVSLSLKNLWGCVPDAMRCLGHQNLAYKLSLIAKLIKPRMVIIDGIYALNKHGPMYGEQVKTNLVLVADNPVVADALGARIMGFAPERVKHISVAGNSGLGSAGVEDLETNQDWQRFQRRFHVEKTIIDIATTIFVFHNDALAKLAIDSPLTSLIYKIVSRLRTQDEKEVAHRLHRRTIFWG